MNFLLIFVTTILYVDNYNSTESNIEIYNSGQMMSEVRRKKTYSVSDIHQTTINSTNKKLHAAWDKSFKAK